MRFFLFKVVTMKQKIVFSVHFFVYFLRQVLAVQDECGQLGTGSRVFPWNVGIYSGDEKQAELICFGTFIQTDAILTAAHCFYDNLGGNLRNKTFYLLSSENLPKHIDIEKYQANLHKVAQNSIHIEKLYKGITNFFENDLAIIKNKFKFAGKITVACMDWGDDIQDLNNYAKQQMWTNGKTAIIEQTYLNDDCHDAPKTFHDFLTVDKSCLKVKDNGIQLNHKSEGAGIMFLNSNRWYIKGIASVHIGQWTTYSTVHQYLNWISNICATK